MLQEKFNIDILTHQKLNFQKCRNQFLIRFHTDKKDHLFSLQYHLNHIIVFDGVTEMLNIS